MRFSDKVEESIEKDYPQAAELVVESDAEREKTSWRSTILLLAVILSIGVFCRFVCSPVTVIGPSMEPTYKNGNILFALRHKNADLERGSVVVFRDPDSTHMLIKRLVGLPGDTLVWEDGKILVNGEPLSFDGDPYVENPGVLAEEITLGEDEVFMVGDNVNVSLDCRSFGRQTVQDIKYVVCFKLF